MSELPKIPVGRFTDRVRGALELISGSVVTEAVDALRNDETVFLGFECPLFIPVRTDTADLLRQREGEKGRPWSAGAGAGVLAAGLAQVHWVLSALKREKPTVRGTTRPDDVMAGRANLLLWEAFVSSTSFGWIPEHLVTTCGPHEQDAAAAVVALRGKWASDNAMRSDLGEAKALSLAGAQLLATGVAEELGLLSEPCLVVKSGKPKWPGFSDPMPQRVWEEIAERDYLQPTGKAWERVYRTLRSAWQWDRRGMDEPPMLAILGGAAFLSREQCASSLDQDIGLGPAIWDRSALRAASR
jgi:hypothetical protein